MNILFNPKAAALAVFLLLSWSPKTLAASSSPQYLQVQSVSAVPNEPSQVALQLANGSRIIVKMSGIFGKNRLAKALVEGFKNPGSAQSSYSTLEVRIDKMPKAAVRADDILLSVKGKNSPYGVTLSAQEAASAFVTSPEPVVARSSRRPCSIKTEQLPAPFGDYLYRNHVRGVGL